MNTATHVDRMFAAAAAIATLGAGAWLGMAVSHAEPVATINLTDVPDMASLPVCAQEDCSDVPNQTGVWLDADTGTWYLERGEAYTRAIIDNTVTR